jgi:hypothetical protein
MIACWDLGNIQYLIGIINKRQRTGPNLHDDDLTITIYEPWKVDDGLPSMLLWASRKIKGEDGNGSSTKILACDLLFASAPSFPNATRGTQGLARVQRRVLSQVPRALDSYGLDGDWN